MRLTGVLLSRLPKGVKYWSVQYANLPESYIKRSMEQVYWETPKGLQYLPRKVQRKKYFFGVHRPWTFQFYQDNAPGTMQKKVFVEPIKDWTFFRGDRVEILVGKDKGKQGIVKQIIQERNWVIVEGLNCKLEKMAETKDFPGIVVLNEQPLLVTSEVSLVDPSDFKSTPIEWRFTEGGEKVRVSTRTGRIIPVPQSIEETVDYKSKATYKEQDKDTKAEDISEITFEPKLMTFEMEIMNQMGIKEDRIPPKTWWY